MSRQYDPQLIFERLCDADVRYVNEELGYARLADDAVHAEVFGIPVMICSLPALLTMKRAAGRPKDLEDLEALKALED